MKRKRTVFSVVVAMGVLLLNCGQCAVGAGITQNQDINISQDLSCTVIGVGFFAIMFGLMLLVSIGGGMGGGREG